MSKGSNACVEGHKTRLNAKQEGRENGKSLQTLIVSSDFQIRASQLLALQCLRQRLIINPLFSQVLSMFEKIKPINYCPVFQHAQMQINETHNPKYSYKPTK